MSGNAVSESDMLAILIQKELRAIILSPKFAGTFLVCSILILLSVFTGIREYRAKMESYNAASMLVKQELMQKTSWGRMSGKVYRQPDPIRIFAAGLDYDIGRWSSINEDRSAKMKNSAYSDDPIFAIFRIIDFSFITRFILTLFAILFTYNAVNGERQDGTLRLVLSNSVSRSKYLIGKCVGAWLGLVVPISIPILLGLLLLLVFAVPLTADHWIKIFTLLGFSLALFTFFITFGVLVSSLTRRSSVSFLVSLVTWVLLITIIPRAGVMAAGQIVNVPRMAEIESQISGYAQEKWQEFFSGMDDRWAKFESSGNISGNLDDEILWQIMEKEDSLRAEIEKEINLYDMRLREDLRQRKIYQQHIAFSLSRISPVSAYQLGAMKLAATDVGIKSRYEESINSHRNQFYQFVKEKQKETGDRGRVMMSMTINEDGSQSMSSTRQRSKESLDISGIPEFQQPHIALSETISKLILDFGLILLVTIVAFAGAFVSFLKYDVR
jgi:ABC-type transport system involved in multi-copper enzyme maturation permease subunit